MIANSATILERFRSTHQGKHGKDINLTLRKPYIELLSKLGNPQNHIQNVIHVAGTNGKGSTCAFLRAIIEAAGYSAHVYTSPYLLSFHESIRIAGKLINESELSKILTSCEQLVEPGDISSFEAATIAAFVAFSRHIADVTILETGLGGRLDATNVVQHPIATIITRLSFDHREFLGNSMRQIAGEKAGIMRNRTPCFAAPSASPEVIATLQQKAMELHAPLAIGGTDWHVSINSSSEGFRFADPNRIINLPTPALLGRHQLENAGLALAALPAIPIVIPESAMRKAMIKVEWPARLQRLQQGELAKLLPQGWELWLDGGHNDSAGEVLAAQAELWQQQDGNRKRPLHIILGMLSTKKPKEFLVPLAPFLNEMCTVAFKNEPSSFRYGHKIQLGLVISTCYESRSRHTLS